jgi:hypothetical protein
MENTGWKWDAEQKTVGGDWGKSPTMAEGIPARLTFKGKDKISVYALDPAGNKGREILVNKSGGELSFGIGAQYKTLWYLITVK